MTSRNLILEIPFPNTWNIFCIFEVMNKAIFLKSICLEIDLSGKVSPKFMSANAESARFKLAYNIHAWAYFEFLGKKTFSLLNWSMVFGRIFHVSTFLESYTSMVWPNFFLMNIFFALKGSKLFTIISRNYSNYEKEVDILHYCGLPFNCG